MHMRKTIAFIAFLLVAGFCHAQKTEIGLGSGTAIGQNALLNYFRASHTIKRLQLGIGADMQTHRSNVEHMAFYAFANATFPIKYGYFYTGGNLGYGSIHRQYIDVGGLTFGGQAGVTVKIWKGLCFNSEVGMRMVMGAVVQENPFNKTSSRSLDMETSMPITVGLRYRF